MTRARAGGFDCLGATYLASVKRGGAVFRPGVRVRWRGGNPTDDSFLRHRKKGDEGVVHDDGTGRPLWTESAGRYKGEWARVRWDVSRPTPMDGARLHGAGVDEVRLDDLDLVAAPARAGAAAAGAAVAAKSCGADGDAGSWLLLLACALAAVALWWVASLVRRNA